MWPGAEENLSSHPPTLKQFNYALFYTVGQEGRQGGWGQGEMNKKKISMALPTYWHTSEYK
jgi:hypothetical protein